KGQGFQTETLPELLQRRPLDVGGGRRGRLLRERAAGHRQQAERHTDDDCLEHPTPPMLVGYTVAARPERDNAGADAAAIWQSPPSPDRRHLNVPESSTATPVTSG